MSFLLHLQFRVSCSLFEKLLKHIFILRYKTQTKKTYYISFRQQQQQLSDNRIFHFIHFPFCVTYDFDFRESRKENWMLYEQNDNNKNQKFIQYEKEIHLSICLQHVPRNGCINDLYDFST